MDTTAKGDALEDQVYNQFLSEIDEGRFWAPKNFSKVYKKKAYYSRDRQKNIIFDISIEIFMPGQDAYSQLILIECKNYNHKVPVDDVEEFFTKIQQISQAKINGVVVSNNAFQQGGFNFAQSKGIGLVRYIPKENLEWVLARSPSTLIGTNYALAASESARKALHNSEHENPHYDFHAYTNYQYTNSLYLFVSSLIKNNCTTEELEELATIENTPQEDKWVVKYKDPSEIESLSLELLKQVNYKEGKSPLPEICDHLLKTKKLKIIESNDLPNDILGKINFSPLEIHLSLLNQNNKRKRFTLAHEIGHLMLEHSLYMEGERYSKQAFENDEKYDIGMKDVMRMEWQANYFASCLLLPKENLSQYFRLITAHNGLYNRGFGVLYVDEQPCNQEAFFRVTDSLMEYFEVSRTALKIRLMNLGLINVPPNNSPNKHFKSVAR